MFYTLENCIKKNNGFFFHDNNNVIDLVMKTYDLLDTFCIGYEHKIKILKLIKGNRVDYNSLYDAWRIGLIEVNKDEAYSLWLNDLKPYLEKISPEGYIFMHFNGLYGWFNIKEV